MGVDEYALLSGDQSESNGWERVWSAFLLRGDDDEQRDYDENRLKIKSKVMVLIFTRPLLQKGLSLQEEILCVCVCVCP